MRKETAKARAREIGIDFPGTPGKYNAITDVSGIEVGFSTINGPGIQTGVTAILPRGRDANPVYLWAGQHTLNGNGEMTGCHWIHDAGYFMSPICITNTHSVGITHHATLKWMIQQYPSFFKKGYHFVMPVIAETYDGILNDINGLHVTESHVLEALNSAKTGAVAEGNVGGGNGMISYEFKAGTGTSSRQINIEGNDYTVGVLVQSNFGARQDLSIRGVPVGQNLNEGTILDTIREKEMGSIIVIIATDVPLIPTQLTRVAKRASLGVARTGTIGGNGSGDIFLAFSTANSWPPQKDASPTMPLDVLRDQHLDVVYRAARDAVEESIVNALMAGENSVAVRPKGMKVNAIDHEALQRVMSIYQPSL